MLSEHPQERGISPQLSPYWLKLASRAAVPLIRAHDDLVSLPHRFVVGRIAQRQQQRHLYRSAQARLDPIDRDGLRDPQM